MGEWFIVNGKSYVGALPTTKACKRLPTSTSCVEGVGRPDFVSQFLNGDCAEDSRIVACGSGHVSHLGRGTVTFKSCYLPHRIYAHTYSNYFIYSRDICRGFYNRRMAVLTRDKLYALTGLVVLSAITLWILGDDKPVDPQSYKCKHGNAPAVCLMCWVEKNPLK